MPSLIQNLEEIGGGVFVTKRGVDTRLGESDLWRAFEEPVIIWVHGKSFDDSGLERLIEIAKSFPKLRGFRFTNIQIKEADVQRLRDFWPKVRIQSPVL